MGVDFSDQSYPDNIVHSWYCLDILIGTEISSAGPI